MRTPTYQDYLANPDAVLASVAAAARAERAEAVHRLVVVPFKQVWKRMFSQPLQPQSA